MVKILKNLIEFFLSPHLPSVETALVSFEKLASSDFKRQGRVPSLPIPPPSHIATMMFT